MKKELTKAEEQIMHAIWKVEKGFAKDILEQLKDPKPAYNTVLTVIRVLVQKGFVKFKTYGKSNEYYPTISKEGYSLQRVQGLKKNYFNNSNAQFLSFFMKENNMSLGDLNEIIEIIKKEEDESV
ncbi:MAG: BlaI family penicillinase repressor [Crocinitomix sp.]|jgi:BlaI family penicillinase repressor